jgi:hypothetical protein
MWRKQVCLKFACLGLHSFFFNSMHLYISLFPRFVEKQQFYLKQDKTFFILQLPIFVYIVSNVYRKAGASFTKLTCIPDASFQNFLL